jgi:hypothetical protein
LYRLKLEITDEILRKIVATIATMESFSQRKKTAKVISFIRMK